MHRGPLKAWPRKYAAGDHECQYEGTAAGLTEAWAATSAAAGKPSWPFSLLPHMNKKPLLVRAALCASPANQKYISANVKLMPIHEQGR